MENDRLGPLNSIIGTFSFMVFGVVGYLNLRIPWNSTEIVFGVIVGLIFGFISKLIFIRLLSILNGDIRKSRGSRAIKEVVRRSTVFMFPYAVLVFLAAYFLGWAAASALFSAAIMNTGVMVSSEVGKLKEKPVVRNTIATSLTATAISYLWMYSAGYLKDAPAMLQSLVTMGLTLLGVKI